MRVDIRDYYMDGDNKNLLPSKRGILLSKEQWEKVKALTKEVDAKMEELETKDHSVASSKTD